MLDLNSIQFYSGKKKKKKLQNVLAEERSNLGFFLNILTLGCLINNLVLVINARIKK